MKKRKYLAIILSVLMLIIQVAPVYAKEDKATNSFKFIEEDSEISYEFNEELVTAGSDIITNPICSIEKINSTTIIIHVKCNFGKMVERVSITLQLQKLSGSSWVTVKSLTSSESNVSSIDKSWTISGLSPGTYRVKVTIVITSNGTSKSFTNQSGSIDLS